MASYTSRTWGATVPMLANGIRKQYADQGVSCEIKAFENVEELRGICPVVVVVKYRPLIDHYVAVLEVQDDCVVIGDPLKGKETLTHEKFMQQWRRVGVIVSKESESL